MHHTSSAQVATNTIAAEFARFNEELSTARIPFVAVGLGRWGTTNPSLGTPLDWSKIAGAKVLVETGLPDYIIDPSFGSHFMSAVTPTFANVVGKGRGRFTAH